MLACGDSNDQQTAPTAISTPTTLSNPTMFDPASISLSLEPVLNGFNKPLFVTSAGDGSGRLFVVEKRGVVRVAHDGKLQDGPFLDITHLVDPEATERGLLGLAFHPDYPSNGRLFVYYTATGDGANTLASYVADPAASRADPESATLLFAVPDERGNHNGGMLAFGPNGYLYIGTGDGGSGMSANGQRRDVLLGKLLRIDVDGGDPYAIPPDNPFASDDEALDEIWAYGLRNPWRFSFDRATGDLYIADVGASRHEEINFQHAGDTGGRNYGWDITEGRDCRHPDADCDTDGITLPVAGYTHDEGCSITGGYVYRGSAFPMLSGAYLAADYCQGTIWSLHRDQTGQWITTMLLDTKLNISSFGEDDSGELYITAMNDGTVYRVVAQ